MEKYIELRALSSWKSSEDPEFEIGRMGSGVDGTERVIMSRQMYENLVGLVEGFANDPNELAHGIVNARAYYDGRDAGKVSQEQLETIAQSISAQ